jgi:hypothetical protein
MKQQLSEQGRKFFEELCREMLPAETAEPTTRPPQPVKALTVASTTELSLATQRERECQRAAALIEEERGRFAALAGAPSYSITSSARSRIDGGIARPSAVAVLRFTTISNFVGN